MKCPVCNNEYGPDDAFCTNCGRRIPRCPTCGRILTTRDPFCTEDGTRLSPDLLLLVPEEPTVPPVSSPNTYTRISDLSFDPVPEAAAPERAFCENCGTEVIPGHRLCADCRAQKTEAAKKVQRRTWIGIILALLILLGLLAGGIALANSELFNPSAPSSSHNSRDEDEDEEAEEEKRSDREESTEAAEEETAAGVEDPVVTEAPTEATEEVTVPEETTLPEETTEATTVPVEDPLLYWIENCDKMYLTEEDLKGFNKEMCVYARNACYAKSGRMFTSDNLRDYFSQFYWYNPTVSPNEFTADMLNAYQNANINLVLTYEKEHGFNK